MNSIVLNSENPSAMIIPPILVIPFFQDEAKHTLSWLEENRHSLFSFKEKEYLLLFYCENVLFYHNELVKAIVKIALERSTLSFIKKDLYRAIGKSDNTRQYQYLMAIFVC